MNFLEKSIPKVLAVLALALLLAAGCAETPEDPDPNINPDTFITTYNIDTAPDSATFYYVTVYWRGTDIDGETVAYRYWVDDGDATETMDTSARVRMDFPNSTVTYTFYVESKDNSNEWDETAASTVIDMNDVRDPSQYSPDTEVIEGPYDGALTSTGIHVAFAGSDIDGVVLAYEYKLDTDTSWTQIDNDLDIGSVTLDILDMSLGLHILSVRSIDNFGQVDASPAQRSFTVVDSLRPDLDVVSGAIEGGFYYLPSGGTTTDVQTSWVGDAAWYFSTLEYRHRVDGGTWSDWDVSTETLVADLTVGDHTFEVEAMDLAGNSDSVTTNFGVGTLTGDRGVLVVNGIHFGAYGEEAYDFWNNVDPITTYGADFWDLFDGQDYSSTPVLDAALIGTEVIPGDELGHYSSAIMILNGYNGDLEVYQAMLPLISSYLNAGGNIFLGCRYGDRFVTGDVATYADASFAEIEVSIPSGLAAAVSGLVDMPGAGLSYTDLPDEPTDPDVTMLFTAPDFPGTAGGFIVEPPAGGKLAFVAGRPYRFEYAPYKANLEYIVTNYFGE